VRLGGGEFIRIGTEGVEVSPVALVPRKALSTHSGRNEQDSHRTD
jgi:hypothetical protein